MEIFSRLYLYLNVGTAFNWKLGPNSTIPVEEWFECISSLSENGMISFFSIINSIKGCLLFEPISLSPEWCVLLTEFIAEKSIPASPPSLLKSKHQVCLKGPGSIFWFSFKSRYDRDIWCEAVMRFTASTLSQTPPSTPYSEYDNWPIIPKTATDNINISSCSRFPSVSIQPKNVHFCFEASPKDCGGVQNEMTKDHASRYICCCCPRVTKMASSEDSRMETELSNCFHDDRENNGSSVDCCNIFCMSIMPGCTLLC